MPAAKGSNSVENSTQRLAKYQLKDIAYQPAGAQRAVLLDVNLVIHAGEQIAVIGPSGAGKTSLLALLAQAIEPSAGTVHIAGQNTADLTVSQRHALRKLAFYAPQSPPLPPRQRVVNAVLAGLLPQWSSWQSIKAWFHASTPSRQAAFEALCTLGLGDKLWVNVATLSGGERQRVALARMLVSKTQAFLVDEPLSALDPTRAATVLQTLQTEARARGATLVCSLHQVDLARSQFDRIIALRDGRVVFDGAASDLSDTAVAQLYAGMPAEVANNVFDEVSLDLPAPVLRCS